MESLKNNAIKTLTKELKVATEYIYEEVLDKIKQI